MRLTLAPQQRCTQAPQLRQEVKALLRLAQRTFRHEGLPSATRGEEGLRVAQKLLIEREAVGILIGGLAESVWRGFGWKRLERHKDVDVLVLSSTFSLKKKFESGIDWWLPNDARVAFSSDFGSGSTPVRYWDNANGVCLSFGAGCNPCLPPGLYLPNADFLIAMRMHEVIDGVKHPGPIDDSAVNGLRDVLFQRYHKGLSGMARQVRAFFGGCILFEQQTMRNADEPVEKRAIGFLSHRFEVTSAIRKGNFLH